MKQTLLDTLREQVVPLLTPYASRIAAFGSAARGDDGPDSDIDLLIRLRPPAERPPLGLAWFDLEARLSRHLGRPVVLVTEDALSRHVRPFIEPDLVVLYEE
ncbi:MAG: nucleotidyltransferase [Alphaproteobacteria bacterium]|nr:MAG: nucleotidyltransferase [Alphaproteobacteria bacterium]